MLNINHFTTSNNITAIILILMIVAGCDAQDDDKNVSPLNPQSIVLQDNAILLEANMVLNVDSTSVTLSKKENNFEVGGVILIPPVGNNAYGDIRKITKVIVNENAVVLETTYASLIDAFKELKIFINNSSEYMDDTNYIKEVNIRSLKQGFQVKAKLNNSSAIPGVKIGGEIVINADPKFQYILTPGSLQPDFAIIAVDIDTEGSSISVEKGDDNKIIIAKSQPLHTFKLPNLRIIVPIPTPVGLFPFPIPFGQEIKLSWLPIELDGKISYKLSYGLTGTVGAKYENSRWSDISNFSLAAVVPKDSCQDPVEKEMSLKGTFVKAEYVLKPLNLSVLETSLGVSEKATVKIKNTKPHVSLTAASNIEGKVNTDFYTGEKTIFTIGGNKDYFETKIEYNLDDLSTPKILSPAEGAVIPYGSNESARRTVVTWEPVEGAISYYLHVQYWIAYIGQDTVYKWDDATYLNGIPLDAEIPAPKTEHIFSGVGFTEHRLRLVAKGSCGSSDTTAWVTFKYDN